MKDSKITADGAGSIRRMNKKPSFCIIIAALAVCAILAICFLANPTDESKDVSVNNVEVRVAATEGEMNTQETGMISDKEAEEMLRKYLSAAGRWNDDYKIEPLNPVDGVIENTKVYRFEVRFQDTVEQVAGRLVDNYAITGDGNTVYWYDSANDEFIILPEAGQDSVLYEQRRPANGDVVRLFRFSITF